MADGMSDDLKKNAVDVFVVELDADRSDVEQQQSVDWLQKDASHQDLFDSIEHQWSDIEPLNCWAQAEIENLEKTLIPTPREGTIKARLSHFFYGLGLLITAVASVALFVWLPLGQQEDILRYSTQKGEQRKLILADGSRAHLNSASTIEIEFTKNLRKVRLLKGEGLFEVVHERSRPFVVQASDSKVVAVGTSFNVRYGDEEITVTVLEGRVAVIASTDDEKMPLVGVDSPDVDLVSANIDPSNRGIFLDVDRQVRISMQGTLKLPVEVDAESLTAWNRGLLVFDGVPLHEVASEISRYIDGDIRVGASVADHPVTGGIKISDRDTMLALLSEVVPITVLQKSSKLTLLVRDDVNEI
jgi:transmembrane sensor